MAVKLKTSKTRELEKASAYLYDRQAATEAQAESLGSFLSNGGDITNFGWADETVPLILMELIGRASNKIATTHPIPLPSIALATQLATNSLKTDPNLTDAMQFVRTGGNHWQLVHAEKSETGAISTKVFNPMGDGACGYRAAAECMSRLSNKHGITFGLNNIVPSNGPKEAVTRQVAKLYHQVEALHRPSASVSTQKITAPKPTLTTDPEAFKIAENELRSTGAILSNLKGVNKISVILSSQQKELNYYAQLKSDTAYAKVLHAEEQAQPLNDEILARQLQEAEYSQDAATSAPVKTSTSPEQLESDAKFARDLQAKLDSEEEMEAEHISRPRLRS